jgi:hypothetical protein
VKVGPAAATIPMIIGVDPDGTVAPPSPRLTDNLNGKWKSFARGWNARKSSTSRCSITLYMRTHYRSAAPSRQPWFASA